MQFAQDDSAEATTTSAEHNGKGRGRGRSKAQKAVVHRTPSSYDDEQRLVELDSTIAAAEAVWRSPVLIADTVPASNYHVVSQERVSLQRRIAEKAILQNLQAKLDEVCISELAKQCFGQISSSAS